MPGSDPCASFLDMIGTFQVVFSGHLDSIEFPTTPENIYIYIKKNSHGSSLPPKKIGNGHRSDPVNASASGDIQVFQALVQLKSLDLSNTQVVGDVQAFQATQRLDSLRLVATQVSGLETAWKVHESVIPVYPPDGGTMGKMNSE